MSKKTPDKCLCGSGKVDDKGQYTFYSCGSVATKGDKVNPVIWSTCPKQDRKKYKYDKSKLLQSGAFMFDEGCKGYFKSQ